MTGIYDVLDRAITQLPDLLREPEHWTAFYFGKPNRCTRLVYKNTVYLHHFRKMPENVVWHPHSWPMAAQVFVGSYVMSLGCGKKEDRSDLVEICQYTVTQGSRYKMENPYGWHKIDLLDDDVWSIMVSGLAFNPIPMNYGAIDFGYSQITTTTMLTSDERRNFLAQYKEIVT